MARSRMGTRAATAALLGLVALAAATAAAPGTRSEASGSDYGDAPDGVAARYAQKPSVRGRFPSRAASGGPRHPAAGPRIGLRWSGEPDSRQVNGDIEEAATVSPRNCATSTLTVVVDAADVEPGTAVYVNAWFDWNQDGDWGEGGTRNCGPEWGIQNFRLDPASLGADRVGAVTLRFRAGRVPAQFWWRVQVHAGPPAPHAAGGGQATPTRGGETDDYFFDRLPFERRPGGTWIRKPNPKRADLGPPDLYIWEGFGVTTHGGTYSCGWVLMGGGSRIGSSRSRDRVTSTRYVLRGRPDGIRVRRGRSGRASWTLEIVSTQEHDRTPKMQFVSLGLIVHAVINGKRRRFGPNFCQPWVEHSRRLPWAPAPPPTLTAAPDAPSSGADVRVTATITNAFMDRYGHGHVSGVIVVTNLGPEQQAGTLKVTITSNRPESARAAEMGGLSCERGADTTVCTISGATVGTEQAYSWALPVSGPGPFTATFSLEPLATHDPVHANNVATVERDLQPEE